MPTHASWYSPERTAETDTEEKNLLNKDVIFVLFAHKKLYHTFITDVTWIILIMSLLHFWALNLVVPLLSMQGQIS